MVLLLEEEGSSRLRCCSGGELMAERKNGKVETARVSADRKKRPLKSGHR